MEVKKPTHLFIAELLNKNQKIIKISKSRKASDDY